MNDDRSAMTAVVVGLVKVPGSRGSLTKSTTNTSHIDPVFLRPVCQAVLAACTLFLLTASGSVCADDLVSPTSILRAWHARQARTQTVSASLDVITHYSQQSQFVPGEALMRPTHGRSAKHLVTCQLDGPAKFRFHHLGSRWHLRFAEILDMDWQRFSNGNRYVSLERAYELIPTWKPKPRVHERPRTDGQQRGWDDDILTPLLHHYRPFNTRHCPLEDAQPWIVKESREINGTSCVLFQADPSKAEFSINQYQYWVAPDRDMSVIRIERFANGEVDWSYDIEYREGVLGPEPIGFHSKRMRDNRVLEFAKVKVRQLVLNQPIQDDAFELNTYVDDERAVPTH